jgi:hypothetical protein|tara:strand:- start:372 stop:488 length:117 start_codon:yes stop_codon:yes gene_type:complete
VVADEVKAQSNQIAQVTAEVSEVGTELKSCAKNILAML